MLPPYIIEQIRKREEDEARKQPAVQLPLPQPKRPVEPPPPSEESERGVVIIDLAG